MDPVTIMLAMQAAGMVTSYFMNKSADKIAEAGQRLTNASIDSNIALSKTQAAEQSTNAMDNLRRTLGSQIAIQTARGTSVGQGSSATIMNNSIGEFNQDQKDINLNELYKEANLRSQGIMSSLKSDTASNQRWNTFDTNAFNTASSDAMAYAQAHPRGPGGGGGIGK